MGERFNRCRVSATIRRGVAIRSARWSVLLAATMTALILPVGGVSATESGNADQAYDFRLVNQDGRSVQLNEFRGKAVLVSYIFTRCPMPTMCPLVTSKMAQVQAAVSKTLKDRVVLVSISFDPAYDTPEVLKEYGERYGADFSHWQFLTGDEAEIQAAAQDANVIYEDMGGGNFTHNMNTVLIAPDGTVRQRFHGSGWKVRDVVEGIQEVVGQR